MSDHDPLCYRHAEGKRRPLIDCDCRIITLARADERERIAQAIEACRAAWNNDWRGLAAAGATVGPGTVRVTYDECARIARSGGSE